MVLRTSKTKVSKNLSITNFKIWHIFISWDAQYFFLVPLELHPQGGMLFLAPAGGSNPAGPYHYGVLTSLRLSYPLLNLTYPKISILKTF